MTTPAKGIDQYLYINTGTKAGDGTGTWTELTLSKDVTFDRSKNSIEANNRGNARAGYTSSIQGLKGFKVSYDSHKPKLGQTPNPADAIVSDAWYSNEEIEIIISEGAITGSIEAKATFAVCTVGGGSESQPLDGVVTINYELINASAPIEGSVKDGEFTANS